MKKKIKIEPAKIRDFLTIAMSVVPKKAFAPILECLYIDANKDRMRIVAGSFDSQVAITIDESFEDEFSICVPANIFCNTISKLYVASVTLEFTTNKATIVSGKSKYSMPTFPGAEYPQIKLDSAGSKITVDGERLNKIIANAAVLVDPSEAVSTFSSINLVVTDGKLEAMGCDGACGVILSTPSDSNVFPSSLMRRDLYSRLASMKFSGPATIESDGKNIEIQCANFKINSRLPEDKYADLAKLFTFKQDPYIVVSKIEIIEALRRLKLFTALNKSITFDITETEMTIIAKDNDLNKEASEVLGIENSSVTPLKITLNIDMISKIIERIENERINIHLIAHNKPAYLFPATGSEEKWMIMPCVV